MRGNKKEKIAVMCMIALIIGISTVYAMKVCEIVYTNSLKTGSVDVDIKQYQIVEDKEIFSIPDVVMPNQNVSYIPRVTNLRADAWVRVRVDIVMDTEKAVPVTLDDAYEINPEWIQKGNYFYLTRIMKQDESSDLFKGIHVPSEWEHESASGFKIRLTADAVQALNFIPDFDSAYPWGSLEIQQAKQEDNIEYNAAAAAGKIHGFTYTSGNGLEASTEDLFENFSYFMAGGEVEDTLEMKNASENRVRLYFKTETEDRDLIKQMKLEIICGGKQIYEGTLASDAISEWVPLADLAPDSSEKLEFRVWLPDESDNYFTLLKDKVIWKFKCIETDAPVQTGDDSEFTLLYAAVSVAVLVMIYILLTGRRSRKK